MAAYSYMEEQWTKRGPEFTQWLRQAATTWRREPTIKRLTRPTRIDRARRIGYKAVPGVLVVRVRLTRGGARKKRPASGRRQKAMGVVKFRRAIGLQEIAERRAAKRYPNCKVKDSYYVYSDGRSHWYEIVLQDSTHRT